MRKPKNQKKSGIAIDKISDRYLDSFGDFLFFFIGSYPRSSAKWGEIVWPLAEPSALLCLGQPAATAADGDTAQLNSFPSSLYIHPQQGERKTKTKPKKRK